jgi:hypothetical protein
MSSDFKEIKWRGASARYSREERTIVRELRERGTPEREIEIVHFLKATFPGSTLTDAPKRVHAVGGGTRWDARRNSSENRIVPEASAEAAAALAEYAEREPEPEQPGLF